MSGSQGLNAWRSTETARTKVLRSVSSASFEVRGEDAFGRAVATAAAWMRERNPLIEAGAETGGPFDVGGGGESPARAIVQDLEGTRIWAATLDDPDSQHVGRTWVTEIVVACRNEEVHVGARLFNVTRGNDEFFQPSLPGLVRRIVEETPCVADGRLLSSEAGRVDATEKVEDLIGLIERPGRLLPVVVMSEGRSGREGQQADQLARRLAGAAHVFFVRDEMTWPLRRLLGRQLSVFGGGVRVYVGGFRADDADPFDHPLWLPRTGAHSKPHVDGVQRWVLDAGSRRGENYPRFAAVREMAVAHDLGVRRRSGATEEMLPLYVEENARLERELSEMRAEYHEWLRGADEADAATSRRIQELQADVARLRGRYEQMRLAFAEGAAAAPRERLEDLTDFEGWVERNVGPTVWFAPKAIRAVEKNYQFADPGLIGDAIYMIEDLFVPMKREPGAARRDAYARRLAELGLEDTPCFVNRADIKRFPEYSVTYRSERRWCDRHLKHGGGADPRSMFRIYFCWDEDEQVVIVGHLPTHLANNMTN